MPEGHLVSTPPLCQPCSAPQGQAESGGMVLVAYAGPVRPAAALRASVLCLPTDIHSLFVNKLRSACVNKWVGWAAVLRVVPTDWWSLLVNKPSSSSGGTSLLHLGSAVALGVLLVHCVSFE